MKTAMRTAMRTGKGILLVVTGVFILTSAGCGKTVGETVREVGEETAEETVREAGEETDEETVREMVQETVEETTEEFSFADLDQLEFYFSSGAGGWYEVLHIHEAGSFDGHFQDSDMGVIGDDYPNGTLFYSDYTGTFTQPEKVDETTWVFQIDSIRYTNKVGTDEIRDQICYVYTDSYGLGEAEDLYLYLPGSDIISLPEEYRSWVGYYYEDPDELSETALPFYGLYNQNNQTGFSSSEYENQDAYEQAQKEISQAQIQAEEVETEFQNARTQYDMNMLSGDLYKVWDHALNTVWQILKTNLDEETMEGLIKEERAWITMKEKEVNAAGDEFSGGTMEPMAKNLRAAELTKDRVYELQDYLR